MPQGCVPFVWILFVFCRFLPFVSIELPIPPCFQYYTFFRSPFFTLNSIFFTSVSLFLDNFDLRRFSIHSHQSPPGLLYFPFILSWVLLFLVFEVHVCNTWIRRLLSFPVICGVVLTSAAAAAVSVFFLCLFISNPPSLLLCGKIPLSIHDAIYVTSIRDQVSSVS